MRSRGADRPVAQGARAVTRVLEIFELLARRPEGLTLSEIAASLAVPVSSLHSLLRVLQGRGYLHRQPDGRRFCLGSRLVELSLGYLEQSEPFAAARQAMQTVADRCGETAHVAVLSGREVSYLAGSAARYPLGVASRVGTRLPAHATAAGKALLATLSDEQVIALYHDTPWSRPTMRSPASLADLLMELEEVRWAGYAHDVEGVDTGLQCVAVALPHRFGGPTAALSVSVPTARLQGDELWRILGILREVVPARGAAGLHRHSGRLVGWSLANTHNETYREMRGAATAAMVELGGQILWTDAHDDAYKQAADVSRLLEERLDALLIHPVNAVTADALFVEARSRNVLTVCFQRPARSRAFDFFVGGNTYQEGCMQAQGLAEALGGRGGVLVIEGDPYNDNARNIAQGNRDTLALYPHLAVLDSQPSALWSREVARQLVREALATHGPDRLRGIIAANDDMAVGIAEILAEEGFAGRVALVGGDGDHETLDLIRSGVMSGTAFQNPAVLAVAALTYVIGVIEGTTRVEDLPRTSIFYAPAGPPVSVLDVPYTWIDRTNLELLERYWSGRVANAPTLVAVADTA